MAAAYTGTNNQTSLGDGLPYIVDGGTVHWTVISTSIVALLMLALVILLVILLTPKAISGLRRQRQERHSDVTPLIPATDLPQRTSQMSPMAALCQVPWCLNVLLVNVTNVAMTSWLIPSVTFHGRYSNPSYFWYLWKTMRIVPIRASRWRNVSMNKDI